MARYKSKIILWCYSVLQLCFVIGNTTDYSLGKFVTLPNCGKILTSTPRIVGGYPVREGLFPWMVTLHEKIDRDFEHICGGSVVNRRWIVTAAHCLDFPDKPVLYEVYVGLHSLSKKSAERVKKHMVSQFVVHENFSMISLQNDIALVKTADDIDFGGSEGFVNGICLPLQDTEEPTSKIAVVMGWGHTEHGGNSSDVLLSTFVNVTSREDCKNAYAKEVPAMHTITENMICAAGEGLDSCQGDSGGPLIMFKNRRAVLFGIVSFGNGCALEEYPGVYTRVSSYSNWIALRMLWNSLDLREPLVHLENI